MRLRVDRERELETANRLILGPGPTRIALIESGDGMGKSELLREIYRRCPAGHCKVLLDFKGGGLNLSALMFHICDTVGWRHFPSLSQAIQSCVRPALVNVSGNLIVGQSEIAIALGGSDLEAREIRQANMTAALVDDLRAIGPVLLLMDTFEHSDPFVRNWLGSSFFPAVHRSASMTVIVSGRLIPEVTSMWEAEVIALGEIALAWWIQYAMDAGVDLSPDYVRGVCDALGGHSLGIAQIIDGARESAHAR